MAGEFISVDAEIVRRFKYREAWARWVLVSIPYSSGDAISDWQKELECDNHSGVELETHDGHRFFVFFSDSVCRICLHFSPGVTH